MMFVCFLYSFASLLAAPSINPMFFTCFASPSLTTGSVARPPGGRGGVDALEGRQGKHEASEGVAGGVGGLRRQVKQLRSCQTTVRNKRFQRSEITMKYPGLQKAHLGDLQSL